eukprot:351929-Chlamydomonas_euryale.AAC.12
MWVVAVRLIGGSSVVGRTRTPPPPSPPCGDLTPAAAAVVGLPGSFRNGECSAEGEDSWLPPPPPPPREGLPGSLAVASASDGRLREYGELPEAPPLPPVPPPPLLPPSRSLTPARPRSCCCWCSWCCSAAAVAAAAGGATAAAAAAAAASCGALVPGCIVRFEARVVWTAVLGSAGTPKPKPSPSSTAPPQSTKCAAHVACRGGQWGSRMVKRVWAAWAVWQVWRVCGRRGWCGRCGRVCGRRGRCGRALQLRG